MRLSVSVYGSAWINVIFVAPEFVPRLTVDQPNIR